MALGGIFSYAFQVAAAQRELEQTAIKNRKAMQRRILRITGEENREYLAKCKLDRQKKYLAAKQSKEIYDRQRDDIIREYGTGVRPSWISAELAEIGRMSAEHAKTIKEYEDIEKQVMET